MSSRIPTANSMRKPPQQPLNQMSRLPVPQTTAKKPPQPMASAVSRLPLSRSAFKRPSSVQIGSEVTKKRMTPMSLLKPTTSSTGFNFPGFQNPIQSKEVAAALKNLPESNFQTPASQKENTCFNDSYEKIVRSSPISIPRYSPVKRITTSEKEINTDIEWTTFNKEAEICFYKSQITALQKSLTEAEFRDNESKNDKELRKLECEKLRSDLERLTNEAEMVRLENVRIIQEKDTIFQEQNSKFLNDILVLQDKLLAESKLRGDSQTQINVLENEISFARNQMEKANAERELINLALENAKMKEESNKLVESELKIAKEQLESLQSEVERFHEKEKLSQIFSNELKDLKVMEEENHALKIKLESLQESCNEMKLLQTQNELKEMENFQLKEELQAAQKRVEELSYAQIQLNNWQTELDCMSPDDYKMEQENMRSANLVLTNDNHLLKNEVQMLREQILCHETEFSKLNVELQNSQLKVDQQEELMHELEEKQALLNKRNEILNEKFEEISSQKTEVSEQLGQQIDQLQNDVRNYKIILNDKDTDLFIVKNEKTSLESLIQERNSTINDLNDKLHSFEAQIEQIQHERFQAEHQIEDVRVVSLTEFNPYRNAIDEREKRFKSLIEENAKLTSLVEVLQSDQDKANMTIQMNNVLEKNSQIAKLEVEKDKCRKVLEKERKNNHELVRKLRSHITDLTGYKIYMDRLHESVTLKHTLDERFKIQFNFQTDDLIELVDISKLQCCPQVEEYVQKYLENGDSCYPAFLAALTLDLFNRRL